MIPPQAHAETATLGPLIDSKSTKPTGCLNILGVVGLVAAALVLGFAGLIAVGGVVSPPADESAVPIIFGFAGFLGLLGMGLGVLGIVGLKRKSKPKTLALHEGGVMYDDGTRRRLIRWEEITTLKQPPAKVKVRGVLEVKIPYACLLRAEGQPEIVLSGFGNVRAVGKRAEQETLERILPQLRERLERGETVRFGTLSLSADGVGGFGVLGGGQVRWEEVEGLYIDGKGRVALAEKGALLGQPAVPFIDVPNGHLFFALAAELQAQV